MAAVAAAASVKDAVDDSSDGEDDVPLSQLQAEAEQSYIGYGFLKGLWLWRDQPYIRVQHFAPVQPRAQKARAKSAMCVAGRPVMKHFCPSLRCCSSNGKQRIVAFVSFFTICSATASSCRSCSSSPRSRRS